MEKHTKKLNDREDDQGVTFNIVKSDLPGGVLFFGKISWESGDAKYIPLTAEEKIVLEKYLENKGK